MSDIGLQPAENEKQFVPDFFRTQLGQTVGLNTKKINNTVTASRHKLILGGLVCVQAAAINLIMDLCFEQQHQCQSRATSTHIQSFGIRAAW